MKKGSFILGLGVGIFAMSVIFMLLGNALQGSQEQARLDFAQQNSTLTSEVQVLTAELETLRAYTPVDLTDHEIAERAAALGMVFTGHPESPYDYPSEYHAEYPYDEHYEPYEYTPAYTGSDPIASLAQAMQDAPPAEAYQPAANYTPSPNQDYIRVQINIPGGSSLAGISRILYEHGIISDAASFTAYAVEIGADTRLQAGTFSFDRNTDFDDVLSVLTRPH